jgi:hypothetical protein
VGVLGGVRLIALIHTLICVCFCANSSGSNPRHFVGKAICSGEGKGIRVSDGKSKGERASRGSGAVCIVEGFGGLDARAEEATFLKVGRVRAER